MLTPDSRIPNTGNHHVVLFGGAFNPPHIGHLIVIQQAFEMIPQIDELWLLPDNVGSFGKELAPAQHRLAMCQLLINELPKYLHQGQVTNSSRFHGPGKLPGYKPKVDILSNSHPLKSDEFPLPPLDEPSSLVHLNSILIDQQLTGETYENLKILKTAYPSHSFSFLMGSDNVVNFAKWSHWQDLPKLMHFYIYPRNGHSPEKLYHNMSLLESDTQVITNFS
ncbi:hypothetical protein A3B57_03605, partial [Microgenomates group bacterium RIFCSPLOWO2_01_FULL_47_10]